MPLYEYRCLNCGKKFDVLQKFSDAPITVHTECGGAVEKMVSAPAFHFKGTGWYVTDYAKSNGVSTPASEGAKSEPKADGAKTDAASGSSTPVTTETKTEASPAPAASSTTAPTS